jgi:DNA helicase-2/ATP-dependent DNA helicase PcrA
MRGVLGIDDSGSQREDRHLPEIAALLDPRQFELISKPDSGLVVIQGGAGSGKTTIGVHRLAFLAYQNKQRFAPDKMLSSSAALRCARTSADAAPGIDGSDREYAQWAKDRGRATCGSTSGRGLPRRRDAPRRTWSSSLLEEAEATSPIREPQNSRGILFLGRAPHAPGRSWRLPGPILSSLRPRSRACRWCSSAARPCRSRPGRPAERGRPTKTCGDEDASAKISATSGHDRARLDPEDDAFLRAYQR